jgi:hypothetical protein
MAIWGLLVSRNCKIHVLTGISGNDSSRIAIGRVKFFACRNMLHEFCSLIFWHGTGPGILHGWGVSETPITSAWPHGRHARCRRVGMLSQINFLKRYRT